MAPDNVVVIKENCGGCCCGKSQFVMAENVVVINYKGYCCGKSHFVIDTDLNDTRLIGLIPPEEVKKKIETVIEGYGKRAAPWYIWLFYVAMVLAATPFFLQIRKELPEVRCTHATQVCSVVDPEYDLSTCNKFWCCPYGFHEDAEQWSSKDFIQAGCVALAGSEPLRAHNRAHNGQEDDESKLAELCRENVGMTHCKCNNGVTRMGCGVIRIEGENGNFQQTLVTHDDQFYQLPGQVLCQLGWIIPACFYHYKIGVQKRFLKAFFNDWSMKYGIETKYEFNYSCTKWYGKLYFTLPQSFQTAAEHTI